MTYNIEDVRTADVKRSDHPRLLEAASRLQSLRPDVLLINELSYDAPGGPDVGESDEPGQNARRLAETYLARAQADSLEPLSYQTVMLPVNTGRASGLDLNNDGRVVTDMPQVPGSPENGAVAPQNEAGRVYGDDAWGFGTFPGQYGMALFVRDDLEVLRDSIRTLRLLPWSAMPNPSVPVDSVTGEPYYSDAEWETLRLSSKSHWDIPIRLPDGRVVHVLASHPTPPTFDGAANHNGRRNHDEIQLWADYITGADYIVDDSSRAGGLPKGAAFVIMGDQNADPDEGDSYGTPIVSLIALDRVQDPVPTATERGQDAFPDIDPDDTARWGPPRRLCAAKRKSDGHRQRRVAPERGRGSRVRPGRQRPLSRLGGRSNGTGSERGGVGYPTRMTAWRRPMLLSANLKGANTTCIA